MNAPSRLCRRFAQLVRTQHVGRAASGAGRPARRAAGLAKSGGELLSQQFTGDYAAIHGQPDDKHYVLDRIEELLAIGQPVRM